jgi:hypothetical protein
MAYYAPTIRNMWFPICIYILNVEAKVAYCNCPIEYDVSSNDLPLKNGHKGSY